MWTTCDVYYLTGTLNYLQFWSHQPLLPNIFNALNGAHNCGREERDREWEREREMERGWERERERDWGREIDRELKRYRENKIKKHRTKMQQFLLMLVENVIFGVYHFSNTYIWILSILFIPNNYRKKASKLFGEGVRRG